MPRLSTSPAALIIVAVIFAVIFPLLVSFFASAKNMIMNSPIYNYEPNIKIYKTSYDTGKSIVGRMIDILSNSTYLKIILAVSLLTAAFLIIWGQE